MEKVYLVELFSSNTETHEDYDQFYEVAAAFKKKEDAVKYISDIPSLINHHCFVDNDDDISCNYRWNATIEQDSTTVVLTEYFKTDSNMDRDDPKNWRRFGSWDITNFTFEIKEMELR